MDLAILCFAVPPALSGVLVACWSIKELCRAITRRRLRCYCCCAQRVRLYAEDDEVYLLCRKCDAGDVVEGRWTFGPPVDAEHGL